jgi:acyl carrier protein
MTQQEILKGFAEILDEIAGVAVADVTPEKSFINDLDLDSLTMVEVATAAEDKFGVQIPDDDLKDLKTVQDAVVFVEKAGVAA